jgi:hypothetical protein
MKTDVTRALEEVLDFCNDRWLEADRPPQSGFPTADMLTGKKMAFNDVIQHVRTKLADCSGQG